MKKEQKERIEFGKGFIAALDQSGGSTPKALKLYGIGSEAYHNDDEMFALVHEMRSRIIKSPSFNADGILGTILFEKTMDGKIDDLYTADYLWQKKHIVSFLKVDKGLAEEADGVQLMKSLNGLDELLRRAKLRHVFGTKMRSVIQKADAKGIEALVKQQFSFARMILTYGLVPIVEPEVNIHIADKQEAEVMLLEAMKRELDTLQNGDVIMLKLTLPSIDNFYHELTQDPRILKIVALSGGYTRDEANARLARNNGVIASFSRALLEGLNVDMSDEAFDQQLATAIASIKSASIT